MSEQDAARQHALQEGMKPTNPKDAIGSDKLPYHLWPPTATIMGAMGLLEGMLKYGRANWREAGIRFTIYYDALQRHLDKLKSGEMYDEDSGLPHFAHILACAAILTDAWACGQMVDDRDYNGDGYLKLLKELTPNVKRMKEKYKDRDPRHWTIADNDSE